VTVSNYPGSGFAGLGASPVVGLEKGDVEKDEEGLRTMKKLG
jgi:hypothetical protein